MSESRPVTSQPLPFDILRTILAIVGGLALVAGMAGGIITVALAGSAVGGGGGGRAAMTDALIHGLGIILAGILIAAILWAASAIVGLLVAHLRNLTRLQTTEDDVRAILGRVEQSLHSAARSDSPRSLTAESLPTVHDPSTRLVAELLEQVRDLQLMDDPQRQRWAERHWARRKSFLTEIIEREVLVGQWTSAFNRLDDLQTILPDDPAVKELRLSVETEQATRLEEDLRSARAQVRNLTTSSLWQQAEDLAASLRMRYPNKAEPAQLLEQVRHEHEAFEHQNADRLFREVASTTERRQWRMAIHTLEEFIRRYPNDKRADALRLDLPTLQENAAAHERKEQEEQFKDLLKRQRYDEAIAIARSVLAKYPQSSSAVELNKLLPRVEEMARQAHAAAAQQPVAAGAT